MDGREAAERERTTLWGEAARRRWPSEGLADSDELRQAHARASAGDILDSLRALEPLLDSPAASVRDGARVGCRALLPLLGRDADDLRRAIAGRL
jgi:hypothetical protein